MRRAFLMVGGAVGLVGSIAAEAYLGSTRYTINGVSYDVPHKYEFMRQFSLPWLKDVQGLDADDPESIMLLFPASEVANGVRGYRPTFRGYHSEGPADMVVTVRGGKEAREFPEDRINMLNHQRQMRAEQGVTEVIPDPETGMNRVVLSIDADGDRQWDLMPAGGNFSANWLPPSCDGSSDARGKATYDCTYWIQERGLTFEFMLRQGNLNTAAQIPEFVLRRMDRWRAN